MRNYCEVNSDIWTDDLGQRLRGNGDAQILAFYLMTSAPSNTVPTFPLPLATIADDLSMTSEEIASAFSLLKDVGFAEYDAGEGVVVVRAMASYFR